MLLSEIFEQLTYGELAQINLGGADVGEILPVHYARVVSHINMGLTALHTRFLLREDEVIVQEDSTIEMYNLTYAHAVSNPAVNSLPRYIADSVVTPFQDNVIMVERILNEAGEVVPLNDSDEPLSLFLPRHNIIQQPNPDSSNSLSVIYRANHEKLVVDESTDPATVIVHLPPSYLQALMYFVAGRIMAPMGTDAGGNEGDKYMALFDMECRNLEKYGVLQGDANANRTLEKDGWV